MKKSILILFFSGIYHMLSAQNMLVQKTDSVSRLVIKGLNEKNPSYLYTLTGTSFKSVLTEEAFSTVCQNNLFPLGKMNEANFIKESDGICSYKAVFGQVNLTLLLGLDKSDKIETLLFKPYGE